MSIVIKENLLPPGVKLTPMLQQWLEAKRRARDAILLFRMGDFYELFAGDAVLASPILELALTSRDKDKNEASIPMAGFPHHSASVYIAKLIAAGLKVAICDQMENPLMAKGIVKREITRIVTPGTVMDDDGLKPSSNNYLVAVTFLKNQYGLAALDISTGDFIATKTFSADTFLDELSKISPAEILLVHSDWSSEFLAQLESRLNANRACHLEYREKPNHKHASLKKLGALDDWFLSVDHEAAIISAELILNYIEDTQGQVLSHISSPRPYSIDAQLMIDATSRMHLDLSGLPHEIRREGTLLWVIDKTCTAMGARQLARWILSPSTDLDVIKGRHDMVQGMIDEPGICTEVREILKDIYDLERLAAKVTSTRVSPRNLAHLRNSLEQLPKLLNILQSCSFGMISTFLTADDMLVDCYHLLKQALVFDPPLAMKDGGIFRLGHDETLDEIVQLSSGGRDQIAAIEQRERDITGISSLKVKYTRVFGYYIEITKTHLTKVPEHYRRKQTVASGERYVTPELMQLEELVATAEVRRLIREAELFESLREKISRKSLELLKTAHQIARLDALCAFAQVAEERRYVRPTMLPMTCNKMEIIEGRHPVVEVLSERRGDPFVPNDTKMTGNEERLLLVTGPNMAGKSTIMRQVALIQLLAQAGAFVPAKSAVLSICDRIFTRVGAADDLKHGRSTFMVEMTETAHILKHATSSSLVLLDEIGRGTSTFDGLSLAWAIAEHLHDEVRARTLFATHYHELVVLSDSLSGMRNMQVAVREVNDSIVFLYRLIAGAAEQSYGIHVARLAGLPCSVLLRAEAVLVGLESEQRSVAVPAVALQKKDVPLLKLGERPALKESEVRQFLDAVLQLEISRTTPLEALSALDRLQILASKLAEKNFT
jgi:DNA mismatch repair protein MutS